MNILFFISTLGGGGAERIALTVAESIPGKMNKNLCVMYDVSQKYTTNIPTTVLSHYPQKQFLRLINIPRIIYRLVQELHKKKIDVSISFLTLDNIINILANLFYRKKVILSVHSMPAVKLCLDKLVQTITFTLAKRTNTSIVVVSNEIRDELIHLYGLSESQISVIYNPIDISTIQELAKEEELDARVNKTVPLIITVGRLNAVKGQWHLIRAFAELRIKQECQLLICGEGTEKEYLSELIRNLGIEDDVVFLGWQENPYKYMKRSTLFVQSSLSEALPNVLVESMACGCPVVAAGCSGGIEEILGSDDRCGFIVGKMSGERYSAEDALDEGEMDLYSAMLRILEDMQLRADMATACKERGKMFDLDIGVQKYVELIEDVCHSQ